MNVALLGGVSWRTFDQFHSMTVTWVGPGVTYQRHPNLRSFAETRPLTGGGLTAGVLVPIRVAGALDIAPEFRLTLGLITDESTYKVAHTGVRVMWASEDGKGKMENGKEFSLGHRALESRLFSIFPFPSSSAGPSVSARGS